MPELFFEDFPAGSAGECGPRRVSHDEIIAYAREFDPQPFHLDEEAAKGTFVGELIASGWQSCALTMRIMFDGLIYKTASMGAPGVEEVKWLRPVRPGDEITARWKVTEQRPSRSRPDMGLAHLIITLVNQRREPVYEQRFWIMLTKRNPMLAAGEDRPKAAAGGRAAAGNRPAAGGNAQTGAPIRTSPGDLAANAYFDDLEVGRTSELGAHTFMQDEIIRFARLYDPQPFHLDPEEARKSHFGALCASGWHTAGVYMRMLVDRRSAVREALLARGMRPPAMGSSPGFKDLAWLRPVYVGDTITFASTLVSKRPSLSRPDWGLLFAHGTGTNQKGELVYELTGSVFMERRKP